MKHLKKYHLVFLTIVLNVAYSHSKFVRNPTDTNSQNSLYFEDIVKNTKLLNLPDLRNYKDSFSIRIWTEKQCFQIIFNNNKIEASSIFFASPRPEKSKHPLVFKRNQIELYKTERILFLFDSLSIGNLNSDNEIPCWGFSKNAPGKRSCLDGITYKIETCSRTIYNFKTFQCPESWDCEEARKITYFITQIESLFDTKNQFSLFINKLPKGCYNTGSFYNFCNTKPKKWKKKISLFIKPRTEKLPFHYITKTVPFG
jgi:hypothetical protein